MLKNNYVYVLSDEVDINIVPIYVMGFQHARGYTSDFHFSKGAVILITDNTLVDLNLEHNSASPMYKFNLHSFKLHMDSFVEICELKYTEHQLGKRLDEGEYLVYDPDPTGNCSIAYRLPEDIYDALYIHREISDAFWSHL